MDEAPGALEDTFQLPESSSLRGLPIGDNNKNVCSPQAEAN